MTPTTPTSFRHRASRRLAQDRGQALVEFAIVLPVLLLIIVGILTFGRYTNYANQETQLAGQAARFAALNLNPASTGTLQSYVAAQAQNGLGSTSSSVTTPVKVYLYTPSAASPIAGTPVVACVISTVTLLPMLGTVTSMSIVESATMRIEQAQTSAKWTPDPSTSVPSACPAT